MDRLVSKYAAKLVSAGLADPREHQSPIIGGMDDELIWNRKGPEIETLESIFAGLSITALVFIRPAPPYDTLLSDLARAALETGSPIAPKDCETRTFLHDLPVVPTFDAAAIIPTLKQRKSVVVASTEPTDRPSPAVITYGTVSPEQGFVVASSVCFAGFVKFFSDYLQALRSGTATRTQHAVFDRVAAQLPPMDLRPPQLMSAPFSSEGQICRAMAEAGRQTVAYNLVDSYFGNISCRWKDTLYISQTGSSLDELEGCIDPVALDGSNSAGLTASSELSAHVEALARTGCRTLIHGHPKFAVILSMDCDPAEQATCRFYGQCHIKCPRPRFVQDIPIVPGEVGTGPTGLCHTLPPALEHHPAAIVYGHGLFAVGREDFGKAFEMLLRVEGQCRATYFTTVKQLR